MGRDRHGRAEVPRGGDRGRQAERPSEIPARGWRDIAKRVQASIAEDNVSIVAAGACGCLMETRIEKS